MPVMPLMITTDSALIVVDVQNDFCPGGSLPVPGGDRVVPVLNEYASRFSAAGAVIIATRDWHPPNHSSFKPYGGIWPFHCIQDTPGAAFHPLLRLPAGTEIISKGLNPDQDAYSGFQDTAMAVLLKKRNVRTVFVGGLATDYCVKSTLLDAIKSGFMAVFLVDGSRGVDVKPGDSRLAVEEMLKAGAIKATLNDIRT
jgi:nicotinamidase/pyrazinamidase